MKLKNVFLKLLALLPYLIVFIGSLYSPTDPDLGWHVKYGEYFFQHSTILRDNTFSTLMPNYHWANVSWGTDIITYGVFHLTGFIGLTILSALIVTATFFFISKTAGLTIWDQAFLFPLLLYLEQPVNAVSFRGQQITLLFLAILFYVLSVSRKQIKFLYLLIPLFLLWTNISGEFLLGIGLFFLWILFYIGQKLLLENKKRWKCKNIVASLQSEKVMFIAFLLSNVATLLNPFGLGVHEIAFSHIGSPLLKDVSEYLPFVSLSREWWNQVVVAILLALSGIFLYLQDKLHPKIPFFGVAIFVYILSFDVRRYAWPAYYLSIPLLAPLPAFFKPDSKKAVLTTETIFLIVLLAITFAMKQPLNRLVTFDWNNYCNSEFILCSPASARYLESHHLTSHVLSLYGWGGWLIWNYPQIKPTIDGRMHLWMENGYSAFADYYGYEQNFKDVDTSLYDVVYMPPNKPIFNHMLTLVNGHKWRLVYRDTYAGIFVRINKHG